MENIMSMLGSGGSGLDPSAIMNLIGNLNLSGEQRDMTNMYEKLKDMEMNEDGTIDTDKLVKEMMAGKADNNPIMNMIIKEGVGFFQQNEEILEEFEEEEIFSKADDFEANLKERKGMWEIETEKERNMRLGQDICDQLAHFIYYMSEQVPEENHNKKVYSMVYELTLTFRKTDPIKVVELIKNSLGPHMHALKKKSKSNIAYALENIDKIELFKSVGVKNDIAPMSKEVHFQLYDYLFEIGRLVEVYDKVVDEETYLRELRVRKLKEMEKKSNYNKQSEEIFKLTEDGKDNPLATAFITKQRAFYGELSSMVQHVESKRDISKIPQVLDAMNDNLAVYKLVKSAYEKHELGRKFGNQSPMAVVRENLRHIPFLGKANPIAFEEITDENVAQLQKQLNMITQLISFIQSVPLETLSALTDITRDLQSTSVSDSNDMNQDVMKAALQKIFKDPKANGGMKRMIKDTMKKLNSKPTNNYRSKMYEEFEQNAQSVLEDL